MKFETVPLPEQITFDLSQHPEIELTDERVLATSFKFGRASFGNELQDAVAMEYGIDNDGHLDMDMLMAAQEAAAYLEDKTGQPFVLIDVVDLLDTDTRLFNGFVGVVPEKAVGLHPGQHIPQAGIAVEGKHSAWFEFHTEGEKYATTYLRVDCPEIIPFYDQRFKLGHPGDLYMDRREASAEQYLIAGEEIVPWIIEHIGDGAAGYELYMDIVFSLTRGVDHADYPALEMILREPFLEMARNESYGLRNAQGAIENYKKKMADIEKMKQGIIGETNFALRSIAQVFEDMENRIPRTNTSYSVKVTEEMDGTYGPQIEERLKALERHKDPVDKLIQQSFRYMHRRPDQA